MLLLRAVQHLAWDYHSGTFLAAARERGAARRVMVLGRPIGVIRRQGAPFEVRNQARRRRTGCDRAGRLRGERAVPENPRRPRSLFAAGTSRLEGARASHRRGSLVRLRPRAHVAQARRMRGDRRTCPRHIADDPDRHAFSIPLRRVRDACRSRRSDARPGLVKAKPNSSKDNGSPRSDRLRLTRPERVTGGGTGSTDIWFVNQGALAVR
jgi:hypothetical protein